MSIKFLETTFAMRPAPAQPVASEIALEAGVTESLAQAYIAAAWEQAENFCGRTWRGYGSGEILIEVDFPHEYRIPRYPYPASVTAEIWSDNARAYGYAEVRYRSGYVELYPGQLYRLTLAPTDPVPAPPHVVQAVANLALYQLIQLPQRREFKSQTQGDTTLSREALMGIFYGSGAGALLASEIRK